MTASGTAMNALARRKIRLTLPSLEARFPRGFAHLDGCGGARKAPPPVRICTSVAHLYALRKRGRHASAFRAGVVGAKNALCLGSGLVVDATTT